MRTRMTLVAMVVLLILVLAAGSSQAQGSAPQAALGTAFTYQGQLEDASGPVSGACDFRFGLYNAATDGTQIDSTIALSGVQVSGGLFTVQLDFGAGAFNGWPRWLEIEVRCPAGSGSYVKLNPRQALNPAPYALYAADAGGDDWSLGGNAGTSPGANYLGTSDDRALELKVNSLRALRLEPNSTSPNLVGGYAGNKVDAGVLGATVGGGGTNNEENWVTDNYGTVGGGAKNRVGDADGVRTDAAYATVAGGRINVASGYYASVGGGTGNTASGQYASVVGGAANEATGRGSVVGGGVHNRATASYATVAGGGTSDESKPGSANWAWDRWTTIGGGANNRAGTINADTTDAEYATVGGGLQNTANARQATVAGGAANEAGYRATVGGGLSNNATGGYATIPGGYLNTASDSYAFAAGQRAKANHKGAFVWADSTPADFTSWQADEFAVRAGGGVRLQTDEFRIFDSAGRQVFKVDKDGMQNLSLNLEKFTFGVQEGFFHETLGDFNFCSLTGVFMDKRGDFDVDIGTAGCWLTLSDGLWHLQGQTDEYVSCTATCF